MNRVYIPLEPRNLGPRVIDINEPLFKLAMTKATEYLFRKSPALMFVLSVHLQKKAQ